MSWLRQQASGGLQALSPHPDRPSRGESMNFTAVRSSADTDPATSFWPFEDIVDFIFLNKIARGENIINITYICFVLSRVLNDFIIL